MQKLNKAQIIFCTREEELHVVITCSFSIDYGKLGINYESKYKVNIIETRVICLCSKIAFVKVFRWKQEFLAFALNKIRGNGIKRRKDNVVSLKLRSYLRSCEFWLVVVT